ncbi:MAG: putative Ig domain-containing protein [bacterium]|nr:putative Ig domain-containing protein [bacterium]
MNKRKFINIFMSLLFLIFCFASGVSKVYALIPVPGGTPDYFGTYPNYANSPQAKADAVVAIGTILSGGGVGATAVANVNLITGAITSFTVTYGGINYTGIPDVKITSASGSGAIATAVIFDGSVVDITVNNGGSGYGLKKDGSGKVIGIRKFVDSLPGLGAGQANNLGKYIPIATADTAAYPGSDYYQIGVSDYAEKMHSDLDSTQLRGYRDLNPLGDTTNHYLGPVIIAKKDKPVRVKFYNQLIPNSSLFLPVDTTIMGAGMGPLGSNYSENRATLHLHGGNTPWISDGTPHQWTVPAGEATSYLKGDSNRDVPDMPATGDGEMTFFYPNEQSGRLMFYHDHSYGITRLNVYGGEAAPYLLVDSTEESLIDSAIIPDQGTPAGVYRYGIPLVIQDKTFQPDTATLASQDPTWNWGWKPGNLWFPHVYMTNQNPYDMSGANGIGRWDYGPWFWPPFTGLANGAVANPYYDIINAPWEPPEIPGTPNPSLVPEAFMDCPIVNGTAYPYINVDPKAYRFRILNACNDRFVDLQLYTAKSDLPMWDTTTGVLLDPNAGEVNMVPAVPHPFSDTTWPSRWPTDGRDGGVPDPLSIGPSMIQIGTEGGLLPAPVVIPSTPIAYEYNRRNIVVLNVTNHALFLGPAERADVVIDFSAYAGKTLILYSDAPAPVPAFDPRIDYYTGDPDQTPEGGAPTTLPGYGPNTRTIMQIHVSNTTPAPAYNLGALQTALPVAYAATQSAPIVPQAAYNTAFSANYPADAFARIEDTSMTFIPAGETTAISMEMKPKAIQELFEPNYGRMNAILGVELPFTNMLTQTTIPYFYIDPPTEIIKMSANATQIGAAADGTQLWKITHNGVDTHAIHVHLFNVQLINRVGWDGMVKPPEPNEIGWKETVRMNPLEDIIIALRPVNQNLPWPIPNSVRLLDVTMPQGSLMGFTNIDPNGNPVTVINDTANFGAEYVWHCHLLGHEENDMMRPMVVGVTPNVPSNLTAQGFFGSLGVNLAWNDNSLNETGFNIYRANDTGFVTGLETVTVGENVTTYTDTTIVTGQIYYYKVSASNTVGSNAPGYPTMALESGFSNTAIAGAPPVITTASPLPTGIRNVFYSQTLAATGGFTPYKWVRTAGTLPAGVTLSTSGVISGTPTNTGTFSFTVKVTDGIGSIATKTFSLRVVNQVSITTVSPLPAATLGTSYSINLAATGGISPYTWSKTAGTLPNGLTLTGSRISGIPTAVGTFNFTVRVMDTLGLFATKDFSITVSIGVLSITTGTPLPAGILGSSYSRTLTATGGISPYSWLLTAGSLPNGLVLSGTGVISGRLTATGTFNFTVQVMDSVGTIATKAFTMTVNIGPLSITTVSPLPSGTLGTSYSRRLSASGGVSPYSWSLTAGNLPNGLVLSGTGLISGTPTATGTFNFTVQVMDSVGTTATKGFSLTVN